MVSRLEILGDLDLIELGVDGPDEHKLGDDEAIEEAYESSPHLNSRGD